MSEIIRSIEQKQLRTDLPKISIGDTVRVWVKVVEGSRERLQAFEGTVIAMRNGGVRETFTVRRVSYGIGVERTFPIHSPRVDHVEIIRHGKGSLLHGIPVHFRISDIVAIPEVDLTREPFCTHMVFLVPDLKDDESTILHHLTFQPFFVPEELQDEILLDALSSGTGYPGLRKLLLEAHHL